jgi:hypothetical protein
MRAIIEDENADDGVKLRVSVALQLNPNWKFLHVVTFYVSDFSFCSRGEDQI